MTSPYSRTVDFASISQTIKTTPTEISGNVITIDPISLTSDKFDLFFYYRGDGIFGLNRRQATSPEMLLSTKTIAGYPFNIVSAVISKYETDIGETISNWDASAIINLRRELLKINSIMSFTGYFGGMTRDEIIKTIQNEGGIVDGIIERRVRLQINIGNNDSAINDIYLVFQFDVPFDA